MAKAKVEEAIVLSLTMDEARDLEGLLLVAVEFSSNDSLSDIYHALSDKTGANIPDFEYNEATGFFEKKEEE